MVKHKANTGGRGHGRGHGRGSGHANPQLSAKTQLRSENINNETLFKKLTQTPYNYQGINDWVASSRGFQAQQRTGGPGLLGDRIKATQIDLHDYNPKGRKDIVGNKTIMTNKASIGKSGRGGP